MTTLSFPSLISGPLVFNIKQSEDGGGGGGEGRGELRNHGRLICVNIYAGSP